MKFSALIVSAFTFAFNFSGSFANECPLLSDKSAQIWQSWATDHAAGVDNAVKFVANLNLDENFSRCAGSADVTLLDLAGLFMNKDCQRFVREIMPKFDTITKDTTLSPLYKEIFDHFIIFKSVSPATFLSVFQEWRTWIFKQSSDVTSAVCANFRNNGVPAIERAVNPLLFNNIFDNDCCSAFKQDFKTKYVGQELNLANLNRAFRDLLNVPCTIQAPGFTGKNQTCQYSYIQSVMDANYMNNFKASISVKENSACAAADGKPFQSYSFEKDQQYSHGIGCCAKPLDKVFNVIQQFPIVQKFLPAEVSTPGKCLKASSIDFLQQLIAQAPAELQPVAKEFVEGLCLHVPVGYSSSCQFTSGNVCDSL